MRRLKDDQLIEIAGELEELASIIRYGVDETNDANVHIFAADPTGGKRRIIAEAAAELSRWKHLPVTRSK